MALCKRTYIRIADPEAEKKLDDLLKYLEANNFSHIFLAERKERDDHFVVISVDLKVSASELQKKIMSIEPVKK